MVWSWWLRVRLSSLFWCRIKVSKRLSGWFLQMINAKAVLIRGLETPFWNAEKVRSDTLLSQKQVSVEMINAKLFWNAFISPTEKACVYGLNCAMQLRSDKAFLSTRTRDTERSMINTTTRERRFERRLHTRFDSGYWNVFLLLGKMINTAIVVFQLCYMYYAFFKNRFRFWQFSAPRCAFEDLQWVCTECIIPYLARDILLYGACCQYRVLHVAKVTCMSAFPQYTVHAITHRWHSWTEM